MSKEKKSVRGPRRDLWPSGKATLNLPEGPHKRLAPNPAACVLKSFPMASKSNVRHYLASNPPQGPHRRPKAICSRVSPFQETFTCSGLRYKLICLPRDALCLQKTFRVGSDYDNDMHLSTIQQTWLLLKEDTLISMGLR